MHKQSLCNKSSADRCLDCLQKCNDLLCVYFISLELVLNPFRKSKGWRFCELAQENKHLEFLECFCQLLLSFWGTLSPLKIGLIGHFLPQGFPDRFQPGKVAPVPFGFQGGGFQSAAAQEPPPLPGLRKTQMVLGCHFRTRRLSLWRSTVSLRVIC